MAIENAILIAGPTASGKSGLALRLAIEENRVVVNADSMQVYSHLHLLSARPDAQALEKAPHLLYGHIHPGNAYSVARWLDDVRALCRNGAFEERAPIFVGGTGLYFRALTEGLSPMPTIDLDIRAKWRWQLQERGAAALHTELETRDRQAAAALRPSDGQRIVRALEVVESTGRSIRDWQGMRGEPLVDAARARRIVVQPERDRLHRNIDLRFDMMMERGALDEARAFGRLGIDAAMPAAKAIGVRELQAAARGEISLDEAVSRAKAATRRYAKRQQTWFRHQLGGGWTVRESGID